VTAERDATRALRALFADDATVLPDRVLDEVLAELPVTRQQRRWRLPAFPRQMVAVAGVAVLAIAVTFGLLRFPSAFVGPGASPSPTPTPTPVATPTPTVPPYVPRTFGPGASVPPGYGTAPPGWPTPPPYAPDSPLPDPAGSPLPADLIGRQYNADAPEQPQGDQAEILTLRPPDDPHCQALYQGRSTCFTILWTPNYPSHVTDSAVRGSARIVNGNLALAFDYVPNDLSCQGTTSTYAVSSDLLTLTPVDVPPCSFPGGFSAH
jgi:hypothetical protein